VYLVDTSAWILALRKKPNEAVRGRVDELLAGGLVHTTGIITVELLGGVRSEAEYERLSARLGSLRRIEVTEAVWDLAAELLFNLRRCGVTVPATDAVIAACALTRQAVLVHADGRYDQMAAHTTLKVESLIALLR